MVSYTHGVKEGCKYHHCCKIIRSVVIWAGSCRFQWLYTLVRSVMFSLRSINYLIPIGSYLALVDTFEESIKGLFCTILIPNKNLQRSQLIKIECAMVTLRVVSSCGKQMTNAVYLLERVTLVNSKLVRL